MAGTPYREWRLEYINTHTHTRPSRLEHNMNDFPSTVTNLKYYTKSATFMEIEAPWDWTHKSQGMLN